MTTKEAIEVLKHTVGNINYDPELNHIYYTDKWVQAYEMALAALRVQQNIMPEVGRSPCASCGYGGKHLEAPPCCDCPAYPKVAERNDPLTLDELRQMDGEPVWVKADHYGVYADVVHVIGHEDGERYVHFKINWRLQENGYGKTWLAYRHKPKEATT